MSEYNLYVVARAVERILLAILPYFIVASIAAAVIIIVYFLAYKKWSAKMVKAEEFSKLEERVQVLEMVQRNKTGKQQ